MPDVETLLLLSKEFGVSINELISGERLAAEDFRKAADDNLAAALDSSSFTLKERLAFFKKKWLREHIAGMIGSFVLWLAVIISLKLQNVEPPLLGAVGELLALLFYVILRNHMMAYAEDRVYRAAQDGESKTKK